MINKEAVEQEVVNRVTNVLKSSPEFDPAIISVLIEMLTDLLAGCSKSAENATPEQAIERVKKLSVFERSMLKSRLKRKAKEASIKNASSLSEQAIQAVTEVAQSASPEERKVFAEYVLPLAKSDFEMI